MLKIEKTVLPSPEQWEIIIEGMRNPMNSWYRIDSYKTFVVDAETKREVASELFMGENDHALADILAGGGPVHAKYRRMIPVWVTINAPLYWWKEFDTYKVGTVCNSCSTMHKIHSKKFEIEDFSCDHLFPGTASVLNLVIDTLNTCREKYLKDKDKDLWWQLIQILPTSYNQKRTIMLNYEVLVGIYEYRRTHKLDEWRVFCKWIEELPHSDLITGGKTEDEMDESIT